MQNPLTQAGSKNRPSLETKPGNETRPNGGQLAFAQFPYPLISYVDGLFQYNLKIQLLRVLWNRSGLQD